MKKIKLTKHDGSRQLYDQKKVVNSILRAGIRKDKVTQILGVVEAKLYDAMSTAELYHLVAQEIEKAGLTKHSRFYRLREALAKMDPIDFEKFVDQILSQAGYSCQWNLIVRGFCVEHQIDVIARDNQGKLFFVEVKHHRHFHRDSGLGTIAELWAQLEDLRKGFENKRSQYDFNNAWLVTNTKFSNHAKRYARCQNLKLSGWRFNLNGRQANEGLEKMLARLGIEKVDKVIKNLIS